MAETRPNDPQDLYGTSHWPHAAGGPQGDPSGRVHNRPAQGAREAGSPPTAPGHWQPEAGATDFLGLETDLRGSGGAAGEGPTESWLFDIEQADASGALAAVAAPPATHTDGFEDEGYDALEEREGGADADLENEATIGTADEARSSSGARRALATIALVALLAAGGAYAWKEFGGSWTTRTEVATAKPVPSEPKTAPAPEDQSAVTTPPAPAETQAARGPIEPPVEVELAREPATGAASDVLAPSPEPAAVVAALPRVGHVPEPVPSTNVAPAVLPPADADLARAVDAQARPGKLPSDEAGPGGGRRAQAADYAGLWLESSIPTDAIHGARRLHTVHVGLVRAELKNGEYIEGRLHAVGESRIWLDVQLGRMSLDAAEVRSLAAISGAFAPGTKVGTAALAGLPRVEILLPGGTLTGRVLGRDGDSVTFVTEEGMRMRVEPLDVRPAPDGRSRLIGRVADRTKP